MKLLLLSAFGFIFVYALFLFFYQRKMIYYPQPYEPTYHLGFLPRMMELSFSTSAGSQTAFYLPPRANPDAPPKRLWVLFHGNASLAMDWLGLLDHNPDPQAGFLLMDYPGYGKCGGRPTRASIAEASEAGFAALAAHLGVKPDTLDADLNILGYSLGAAVGLEFAARHPIRRIIIISPFTTMLEMARRTVGRPLNHLLLDRFDNQARLEELAARAEPPRIFILHGDVDPLIPPAMGKQLADSHSAITEFHSITGADHGFILDVAEPLLLKLLSPSAEQSAQPPEYQHSP